MAIWMNKYFNFKQKYNDSFKELRIYISFDITLTEMGIFFKIAKPENVTFVQGRSQQKA